MAYPRAENLAQAGKPAVLAQIYFSPSFTAAPPVIIVPDLSRGASFYAAFANSLSEAGFFVILLQHTTGDSKPTSFLEANADASLWKSWHEAGTVALDWLDTQTRDSTTYSQFIEKTKVGVIGHGFGGYIAASLCGFKKSAGIFSSIGKSDDRVGTVVLFGTPTGLVRSPNQNSFSGVTIPLLAFFGEIDHVGGFKVTSANMRGPVNASRGTGYFGFLPGSDGADCFNDRNPRFQIVTWLTQAFLFANLTGDADWQRQIDGIGFSPLLQFSPKQ